MTLTALVNNALRRLGEERINDISDSAPRAVMAAELWPNTRDEVLADHEWTIALRRRSLAEINVENLTPYQHIYRLPMEPHCLRVLNLIDDGGRAIRPEVGRYIIEGRNLATDIAPCRIRYIARVEDVTGYDPMLIEAMALKLASKLAYALSQNPQLEQNMLAQYVAVITVAKGRNSEESWQGYREDASWDQIGKRPVRRKGWHE